MYYPYGLLQHNMIFFQYDYEVTWDTAVHKEAPGNCLCSSLFFWFFSKFNRKLLEDVMQICLRVEPPCMYHLSLIENAQ
jgi:hypothetical protein